MSEKTVIDWEGIELHYRAGVKTLRQIADEFGVTHGAIGKRAKRDDWSRDLKAKIDAKVSEKVSKAAVSKSVSKQSLATESVVIEANANLISNAELVQRDDILLGLSVARGLMQEISLLSRPELTELLEGIADSQDQSYTTDRGVTIKDKENELYRYVISLMGRVKMAKETAATHGVYIPMQRKVLRMEADADKGETAIEEMLRRVQESR